jgi:guanosine-3',5'-bis(diphosphate) 3'-pyrophosphohydrolase
VWAVKLADRITNLQPPPANWSRTKNIKYLKESQIILDELRDGNQYLAKRLEDKISESRNQLKRFLFDKV